jgi:hypothetical protein
MMKDFNEAEPFYTDKLQKELIWEELFNLDVLQKNRFRHSGKLKINTHIYNHIKIFV